ncbi:transcriptional regulator, SarA/Rot family, partial [Staphylococcus haemolyticus]|nr:MarR family transcriptional regulator [Staphylococcus haemolyticus]
AFQELKGFQFPSKKRSVQDERIVIVYVTDEQRDKINKLIAELEKYIK